LFCFTLFIFTCIVLSKPQKKLESFIVVFTCFAKMANPENTKLCDFTNTNNEGTEIPIPSKLLGLYEAFENNFDWICPKNLFSDLSEPKCDHKGSSKTYVDEIQCLIEKTSSMDLNDSLDIT
jgi:hypothetical protein